MKAMTNKESREANGVANLNGNQNKTTTATN
jgi:hypothetical protein